ncbi:hypothetical protein Leryth_020666 [Lithospermum erythrorhizon]|nr:hypothetical protein Leryth_020666 [Lithospermum erythrorhizon]
MQNNYLANYWGFHESCKKHRACTGLGRVQERVIAAALIYSLLQPRKQRQQDADTKRVNNEL